MEAGGQEAPWRGQVLEIEEHERGYGGPILALVTGLTMATAAALQADPPLRAEGLYLAFLAAAVLVSSAWVLRRATAVLALGYLLLLTSSWALGPPTRGAVVTLLLAAIATGAAVSLLYRSRRRFAELAACGIALQSLFLGQRLLDPSFDLALLRDLFLLPLLAAAALRLLDRFSEGDQALFATALLMALGGGLSPTDAAALAVVAWGRLAAQRREEGTGQLADVPLSLLAAAALLWLVGWDPVAGLLLLGAGLAAFGGRLWGASLVLLLAVLPLFRESLPWRSVAAELAALPLLLPLGIFGRPSLQVAALVLGAVGLRGLPATEALAAPLVLFALALPNALPWRRPATGWSLSLLLASLSLSSYPWFRPRPLESLLAGLGLEISWPLALFACGVFAAALLSHTARRWAPLAAAVLLLLLLGRGRWEPVVLWPALALTSEQSRWASPQLEGPTAAILVDSALDNAAGLAPGTPVATLQLESAEEVLATWPLRAGYETAEWASGRPDLRHLPAPPPWISQVDRSGTFFARRFRTRVGLAEPLAGARLVLRRSPDLPAEVGLTVFFVARRAARGSKLSGSDSAEPAEP